MSSTSGDWRPACTVEMLKHRELLRKCIRDFFDSQGYMEVDTPLLSHDIVIDAHLDPFEVSMGDRSMYLQTSPEAAMKRLLAAGCGSIYQVTRSFRAGERGLLHNPEFTMLEWYGAGSSWLDQLKLTEELIRSAAVRLPGPFTESLPKTSFQVTTYQQAFMRELGIDVLAASGDSLREAAAARLSVSPVPKDRDDILNLLLASEIEPHLGMESPEFLVDYPVSQAALAQVSADDPRVARRFELYVRGIELCNGYQELTDAEELRRRDSIQSIQRRNIKSACLPGAQRLLAAMESGLPACSGVALGVDRLLMLLTGASSIDECLPFPVDRA